MTEILTYILAPLCVALIVLFFQQVAQARAAAADCKAAMNEPAKVKEEHAKEIEHFREALRAAKKYYDVELDGKEQLLGRMKILAALHELEKKLPVVSVESVRVHRDSKWDGI